MKLIIFSYPMHFRISLLCKKFALKNLPDVSEVVYAWDDVCNQDPIYLEKLRKTENVVLYSEFPNVANEKEGWLRQQFVKLQLHHVFSDNQYLMLDGDTLIRNKYHFDLLKPQLFTSEEYYDPYFYFIKKCLGLNKLHNFSFVSPLFLFEKSVLEQLEEYSIKKNKCTIVEYYQNNIWKDYDPRPPFSECEIYGNFATQILKREFEYKHNTKFHITFDLLKDIQDPNHNLVFHGYGKLIPKRKWKMLANTYL